MLSAIENRILRHARELGADIVGIADANKLKKSPSYVLLSTIGNKVDGIYPSRGMAEFETQEWPNTVKSILVIALSHPKNNPELDWYYKGSNSVGNRNLIRINEALSIWIENTFQIHTQLMPYYVEKGGIYLKDAAVFAGLGCIGKNNLLLTPGYGPRVRLRAMLLEAELKPNGPVDFNPCQDCPEYCREVCPQKAFENKVQLPSGIFGGSPPARDGHFQRSRCMFQMDKDLGILSNSVYETTVNSIDTQRGAHFNNPVKYCRQCEFACPVGR